MPTTEKPKTRNRGPKYGPRVHVGGHFHPDVQKSLREIAVSNGTNLQQLLIEAINHILHKYGKRKIAGEMPEPEAQ